MQYTTFETCRIPIIESFSRMVKKSIIVSGQGILVPVLKHVMDLEVSFQAYICINMNVILNIQCET